MNVTPYPPKIQKAIEADFNKLMKSQSLNGGKKKRSKKRINKKNKKSKKH